LYAHAVVYAPDADMEEGVDGGEDSMAWSANAQAPTCPPAAAMDTHAPTSTHAIRH